MVFRCIWLMSSELWTIDNTNNIKGGHFSPTRYICWLIILCIFKIKSIHNTNMRTSAFPVVCGTNRGTLMTCLSRVHRSQGKFSKNKRLTPEAKEPHVTPCPLMATQHRKKFTFHLSQSNSHQRLSSYRLALSVLFINCHPLLLQQLEGMQSHRSGCRISNEG
jgi:hypothetical protein